MEISALYHRPDSEMAYLKTKDAFQIRLRTKHGDVKEVKLLYGDPYGNKVNEKDESTWEHDVILMEKTFETKYHDYWETEVKMPLNRLQYAFHLVGNDGEEILYDDRRVMPYTEENEGKLSCFRMPYLHEIDRVKTPEWVRKTVWYQIFPERFANGDKTNDPNGTLPWGSADPTPTNFFGGDLKGILDHLDYLQDLGVNGLYLCPIFTATSNHKYDTVDYFGIDPAFGDKETLKELVDAAHERGMHVMLDAVFNHMGDFSMQWKDVQKYGENSRFAKWFHINKFPVSYDETKNAEHAENLTYEVFSTTPHMPKLNTANEETAEYLLEIAQYWIKEFDIDAWRLDVANEIDHHFWKRFYAATHELKSDFYILGEVWHSAQEWVEQEEFDAVMNYPFTESIALDFVNHETTAKEMVSMLSEHLMKYRDQTNEVMLNAMDTHDTARLLTLCHGNKELQRQTLAFMFTQPGAPCVYYGTEVGLDGGFDPGCRKCMIWDEEKQDHEMFAFMQKLIKLRKDYADIWSKGKVEYRNVCDETNSLEVVRSFDGAELHCFFNMGEKALEAPCFGEVLLGQNLKDDKVEKDGFIIVRK